MSTNYISYDEITQSLVESFSHYESKQTFIHSYPNEMLLYRSHFIEWLIFLNKTLSFRTETLFRAITIFDIYISKLKKFNLTETKLALIACLNIATKLEEVNVNFLKFFTERCLNEENQPQGFTSCDLAKKEIEVLKVLNFRTNYTTPYDLLSVFQQLCLNMFKNDFNKTNFIINISEEILINCLYDQNYIYLCPKQIALFTINQTLSQLSMYNDSFTANLIWSSLFNFNNNNNLPNQDKQYFTTDNKSPIQTKKTINTASPMKIQAM